MKAGRELDELIAQKVMGFDLCKCDENQLREEHRKSIEKENRYGSLTPTFAMHFTRFGSDDDCNYCGKAYMPRHQYSTWIMKAFEVVEQMRSNGSAFSLSTGPTGNKDGWCACFMGKTAWAETAAEAICLAAIEVDEFTQYFCPCGGVILADTEDWEIPLCYECYIQRPMLESCEFGPGIYQFEFMTNRIAISKWERPPSSTPNWVRVDPSMNGWKKFKFYGSCIEDIQVVPIG